MRAPAVARVIDSVDPRFPVGSRVSVMSSWQDIATIDASAIAVQTVPEGITAVEALGVYGLNTLTAYFGLLRVGDPKPGETLVVSGAAGATGSVAAQIGKIKGCHVVGIAGGPAKCLWLREECGLDAAIDYRAGDVEPQLRHLLPKGIDIFFDNVGGPILQAAIENMARFGRVVLCGQIAGYNTREPVEGPRNMMRLIYGSIRMQGFLMGDYREQIPAAITQLRQWVAEGRLKIRTDVRSGFEDLPAVYGELFSGGNNGTLLVAIDKSEAESLT
jgi:NADPH-dependent curcumin reductase CurA